MATIFTKLSAGVAVVLRMKKGNVTGVATERESVTEIATEIGKILLVGKVQGHLGDAESALGVGKGTRNGHGNEKGIESTETDTTNLVSFPLDSHSSLMS